MNAARRTGFSLLEVLIATSILLGSVIVLSRLADIGRKNAVAAEDLATAQILCETKLNELLAGISDIDTVEKEPFLSDPEWVYSIAVDPTEQPQLAALKVTVSREEPSSERKSSFSLTRWVRDPFGQDSFHVELGSTNSLPPQDTRGGL